MAGEKPFTGLTASVKVGEEVLAYISGVDMTMEREIIEILAFGMQYKEKVAAVKDWSASVDGTAALATGGTQEKLQKAFESGETIEIGVYLDETNYFKGNALVQSFGISAAPDDKISLTAELAGTGGVVMTLAGA